MNEVRYGIIGCGVIAPTHVAALSQISGANLVAVADVVEEKAKEFANEFGVENYYADYRKLLDRKDIDAVSICTPHYLHAPMAIDSARAGKHVLVEKPMAVTMEEADKLIEECKSAKVKLSPVFQHRFDPATRCVRKAIEGGRLGRLILGNSYTRWYRSEEYFEFGESWRGKLAESAGGALINQAIHMVDLLRWFMGSVDKVCANTATLTHHIEVEDVAVANMKFKNGAIGTVEASVSIVPNMPEMIQIHGSKGTVAIEGTRLVRWDIEGESLGDITIESYEDDRFQGKDYYGNSHPRQIEDFIGAILKDRPPFIDGYEGRKTVELVLAIYESAKTGEFVKFS